MLSQVRHYCLCGFVCGTEDALWKHVDTMGAPHDIREAGDDTLWTGPAEERAPPASSSRIDVSRPLAPSVYDSFAVKLSAFAANFGVGRYK